MTQSGSSEFPSSSPQGEVLAPLDAYRVWQAENNTVSDAHAQQVVRLVMHALDQNEVIVEMEAEVENAYYSAEHDSKTGLLNTEPLYQDLQARMQVGIPVIYHGLDLDAFKAINDTLGHDRGDQVLIELGEWLPAKLQRRSDKIARDKVPDSIGRPGGDEFAIVSNVFDDEEDQDDEHIGDADRRQGMTLEERVSSKTAYVEAIVNEFVESQPQEIRELGFGISVGTAYWDPAREPDLTPAQLVRRADLFMYGKKNLPFRIIIERHRDQLEDVFNFLAEIGMSARDLPKLDPRKYTHYTDAPRSSED